MKSCLLVIDVQESFRHRPYFSEVALPAYLKAQNALIAGCVAAGVPVVRVLHSDGPEVASNPFAHASGHVRPLEGKLWEMRMQGRDGISRAVYAAMHGRRLLVLHVFVKKTQATPRKAIETARKRLENAE